MSFVDKARHQHGFVEPTRQQRKAPSALQEGRSTDTDERPADNGAHAGPQHRDAWTGAVLEKVRPCC